jgi:hypothetical protein
MCELLVQQTVAAATTAALRVAQQLVAAIGAVAAVAAVQQHTAA